MGESLTYPFEPQPPGWDFDELLDAPDDEFARPQDTLLALKAVAQAEAMLHARRLQLMQRLRLAKAGDADGEWTADLVAVELNISIPRAQREVGHAGFLAEELPETLRLLGTGRLDAVRARRVSELAVGLTHEQKAELEQRIYPQAVDLTPRRLTSLVKRQIIAIDPHAAQQQATAPPGRSGRCRSNRPSTAWAGSTPTSPPKTCTPSTTASTASPGAAGAPTMNGRWTRFAPTSCGI